MRNLRRHADAFAQRGVRVDGLADVRRVSAHLNRQSDVDVDEAMVGHSHASLLCADLLAVGRAAHGLPHQVVHMGTPTLCNLCLQCFEDNEHYGQTTTSPISRRIGRD